MRSQAMTLVRAELAFATLGGLLLGACAESDLGTACALKHEDFGSTQTTWVVGEEPMVVEDQILQDGACESFVCLIHQGIAPYCSRPCTATLVCPDGFTCEPVQTLGPRADDSFCVYSACETASDCKDIKKFDCMTLPSITLDPTATFKRCQLRPDQG